LSIGSTCPSRRPSPNEVAPSNSYGWRMFGAPDPHAPGMARGERPGMARACPPHRTSVTRKPSAVGTRSCPPMSNVRGPLNRYRFSCYGTPVAGIDPIGSGASDGSCYWIGGKADAWGAVLKLRRRWRRVAADPLEPSLGAHHAPSMARDGPAQPAATAA